MTRYRRTSPLSIAFLLFLGAATLPPWAHTAPSTHKAVIGVLGDIHENMTELHQILSQFKKMGVTHIIGTGDYIGTGENFGAGGPDALRRILSQITPATGVKKKNIFLVPGNWEHENTASHAAAPQEINQILSEYAQLVTDKYDTPGLVTIDGKKILVSHYPQHALPEDLLPPIEFRYAKPGHLGVMETIQRHKPPDPGIDVEFIGHTHRFGVFQEPESGKLVVSTGTIHPAKKVLSEPGGFAVYNTAEDSVRLFNTNGELFHTAKIPHAGQAPLANEVPEVKSGLYQIQKDRKFEANLHDISEGWGGMGEIGYVTIDAEPTRYYHWEKRLEWAREWVPAGKVPPTLLSEMLARDDGMKIGGGLYVSYHPLDTDEYGGKFLVFEPKKRLRKLVLTNSWLTEDLNRSKTKWPEFNQILKDANIDVVEFRTKSGKSWAKLISPEAVEGVRNGTIEDVYRSGGVQDMKMLFEADVRVGVKDSPWLREHFPLAAKAMAQEPLTPAEIEELYAQTRDCDPHSGLLSERIKKATYSFRLNAFQKTTGKKFAVKGDRVTNPGHFEDYVYWGANQGFTAGDLLPEVRSPKMPLLFGNVDHSWKLALLDSPSPDLRGFVQSLQYLPYDEVLRKATQGKPEPWSARWAAATKLDPNAPQSAQTELTTLHQIRDTLIPEKKAYRDAAMTVPPHSVSKQTNDVLQRNPFLTVHSLPDPQSTAKDPRFLVEIEYPSAKNYRKFESILPKPLVTELKAAEKAGELDKPGLTSRILQALEDHVFKQKDTTLLQRYQMLSWIQPFQDSNKPILRAWVYRTSYGHGMFLRNPYAELHLSYPEFVTEELSGRSQLGKLVLAISEATSPKSAFAYQNGHPRVQDIPSLLQEPIFWQIAEQTPVLPDDPAAFVKQARERYTAAGGENPCWMGLAPYL